MKNIKKKVKKAVIMCGVLGLIFSNVGTIPAQARIINYEYKPATPIINSVTGEKLSVIDGVDSYSNPNIQIEGLDYIPNNYKMNIQQGIEYQILDLLNQKRIEYGLQPLQMDETMVKISRYKSADMIQRQYFSHYLDTERNSRYFVNWIKKLEIPYRGLAENIIQVGKVNSNTANQMFELWWNSEGHRNNMMNSEAKYIGIGVIYDQSHGLTYGTQEFAY
ncbi:CAP domain-containing protein [Clostridium butyricum]|uniref:CAP domain-containing protein n=1 Tax=Clostridium butyricum TaxID=1492 RepID=UPI0018AB0399|nr:CAP domain-containing protein [Clostridium butyricum]MDB2157869.1 CAP domain-containing protein [Clostridium butyricum]